MMASESVIPEVAENFQRACLECGIDISDSAVYHRTCGPCFPVWADKNMRPCKLCGFKKIDKTQPVWKTTCGACYKAGMEQPQRPCERCKKPSINPVSPEWRKLCTACYEVKKTTRNQAAPLRAR